MASRTSDPSGGGGGRPFLLRRKSNPTSPNQQHLHQAESVPATPPTPSIYNNGTSIGAAGDPPPPSAKSGGFMPSFAAPGVPGGIYTSPPAKQEPPTAGPSTLLPSPPASYVGAPGGASLAATLEQLRLVAQKRITTFVYLKRACEGKVHWFNTVLLTRPKLEAALDPPNRLAARTTRFAVLGMSLSAILDITTVGDFVRALVNLLQEYEAIPDANFRPKMKGLFRQSKGPRKSNASSDYPLSFNDVTDSSYLYSPNIPFDLDYFQVLYTLCDILVEVYQRILAFLSQPPSFAGSSLLAPSFRSTASSPAPSATSTPDVSGLPPTLGPTPTGGATEADPPSAPLTPLPLLSLTSTGPTVYNTSAPMISPLSGGAVGPATAELMSKIDVRLKRIISVITKELDGVARAAIKDELALLDPMILGLSSHRLSNPPTSASSDDPTQQQGSRSATPV